MNVTDNIFNIILTTFTAAVLIANSPLPQSVRKMVENSDLPSLYKSLVGYCQTGTNSRDRLQYSINDGKQEIAVLESEIFHEALNNDTITAVKDTVLTYLRGKSDHNYNDAINEYKLLLSKKDYGAVRDALKGIYGMTTGMDSDLRDELTTFCSVNNIYVDYLTATSEAEAAKILDLVYCNLLEHLLLHVKIAAEPRNDQANENELPGIGGAVNYICKQLNDIYAGKEYTDEWRRKVADVVKDDFDDYIMILKYLWQVVEDNPEYKAFISKESICTGYDGKVVPIVLNALIADD